MLVVGCNCWEEELCEEQCNPTGGARPRPVVDPLLGGGAFSSMALTWAGSMEVAASRRGIVEPKIQ
jgi:hypothetical protein